jgi:hypothetical protein
MYSYVGNNPVNYTDPTGHCSPAVVDCLFDFAEEAPVVWHEIVVLTMAAGAGAAAIWNAPSGGSGACTAVMMTGQCSYNDMSVDRIIDQSKLYSKAGGDSGAAGYWDQYDSNGDGGSSPKGPKKPNNNKDQNDQFRDAVKEINRQFDKPLSRDQERRLHDRIGMLGKQRGELLGFDDIIQEGLDMFGGD